MKAETIERTLHALTTASLLIYTHCETVEEPDDVGESDEKGLREFVKACKRVSKMIDKLAEKQRKNLIKCQQKQNM